MTSAAFAVTLSSIWRRDSIPGAFGFGLVTLVFAYTTAANVVERPDGIKIASLFIGAIVATSLVSRVRRSLELRQERIELDETARGFVEEASLGDQIRVAAHRRRFGEDPGEYDRKIAEQREYNRVPEGEPVLFLEVDVADASEFEDVLEVRGVRVGDHMVLRAESSVVPNAIAALLLHLRDTTGKTPNCYFGWTEGNPIVYLFRFLLFGEGDTASVAHEVLREAEPVLERRPIVHVGGRWGRGAGGDLAQSPELRLEPLLLMAALVPSLPPGPHERRTVPVAGAVCEPPSMRRIACETGGVRPEYPASVERQSSAKRRVVGRDLGQFR